MLVALGMIAVGAFMSWETLRYFMQMYAHRESPASASSAAGGASSSPRPAATQTAPWQEDVLSDFEHAAQSAKSGDVTNAEMLVDQAASEMEDARVQSELASSDFFSRASAELDGILKAEPVSAADMAPGMTIGRLFEHVTQARIEVAEMRSMQEPMPPGSALAVSVLANAAGADAEQGALKVSSAGATSDSQPLNLDASASPPIPKLPAGHVIVNDPRELTANQEVDPALVGGSFLDASLMPDEVEILLPPEARKFSDNVRVENLTLAGASQTLDGIHWRNVTFIGTRLRYEDGQLDLHNVRFVHCTFGFPSDQRGASIANTIALGQTSFVIQ
jgi:hypothetical protein